MISRIIIKYHTLILIGSVAIIGGAFLSLRSLEVIIDFQDFFPGKDPELRFFNKVNSDLGSDEDLLILAINSLEEFFDPGFLLSVKQLSDELKSQDQISRIQDITNLQYYHKSLFGIHASNYIQFNEPGKLRIDTLAIRLDSFYTSRYFDLNEKLVYLFIRLRENLNSESIDSTFKIIDFALKKNHFLEYHLIGRKYLESKYKQLVSNELKSSIGYTIGVMVLILIVLFRSMAGVLVPLLSMSFAMVILYGTLALWGRPLGIMSNLFPTIMLIVGISDIIHILSKYDLEMDNQISTKERMSRVIKEIGLSLFITSLTTAIGFLSLCTSSMKAISDFGVEAAIAVIIAFVFSIIFVPALILTLNLKISLDQKWGKKIWYNASQWIYGQVCKSKQKIIIFSILAILLSLIGIFKTNLNNLQLSNIPLDHRLRDDFNYFDKKLGGSRTFELIVQSADSLALRKLEILKKLSTLHTYLEEHGSFSGVISPVTWYHSICKTYNLTLQFPAISESQSKLDRYVSGMPKKFYRINWKLVNEPENMGRFSARTHDIGRLKVNDLNREVYSWISENNFPPELHFQITGTDHMIDRGHQHRICNMFQGLGLALLAVSIIVGLLFKNIQMVVITLIVNVLPLIIVAGILGIANIELRGSTSILFTIGFVIAVDDTIHFLNKYRYEINQGNSISESIKISIAETGRAMVMTSLILIAGFLILIHSQSWDVYVMGYLVSLMLLTALVVDLFLLPVLLLKIFDNESNSG